MKSLILSLALILSAFIAPAASYSVVELVPPAGVPTTNTSTFYQTNANGLIFTNTSTSIVPTPTVVTNGQVGVVGRIAGSPGDTIGIVAAYKGASASSVSNATFYLRDSYDTNYSSLWRTNLSFTLGASGTNTVVTSTNTSVADRGFVQLVVSNGVGTSISNLQFKLFNLNPNVTTP